ncbi:putative cytochrome P450 monooxygenase [Aspergillus fischeri NRRL 181]|uniref:Cytochrome P450 n=1 Tax=Neosartorya fischeri (strain ATCC 1020 / DSM 3700 / CBS 544.65 / FGSC A1164 / JCM 1740 / NRRL 181 / WB 181) TaxID=331117 RepID=A1DPE7_NEOFI|nr:conserved hypothetical protein [Aspergillus fischeri NRRL 181]EAW16668.1 conserved hypothetical protein [Aspergillus fischeri NRRL 181]
MAVFAALLLLLCVFGGILWNYTRLNTIPGPLLAGLSDIWSQCLKSSPRYAYRLQRLHRKYGEVVRIGPKTVSVTDPSNIFWLDAACPQSYVDEPEGATVNSQLKSNHRVYLDEQTDDGPQHNDKKDLVLDFLKAIRKQRTMKLTVFRDFATDIVGRMFVGDLEDDRAAPMRTGSNQMDRCRFTTSLDHIMFKNPVAKLKRKRNKSLRWVSCAVTHSRWDDASIFEVLPETGRKTFLQAETREYGGPYASLIVKGADCMVAAFVSVFRHLLKCPTAMSQLQHEVDNAFRNLTLSDILQQETELHALSFLDAVIKESMRLALRFDYLRDVPAGGLAVLGHYLPEGTVVQFHSEALRNNRTIFGEDVSDFRPQRWLQADLDQWQRKQMEALLFLRPNMPNSAKARAAWLELKRAAALIILKFDLRPLNYEEVFIQDAVSREQEYEILVNFTPRMH